MKNIFVFFFLSIGVSLAAQEAKTIHVKVALCDNVYQGIVKVPKAIGNGQDPKNNLYWGCGYGVSTYFKKNSNWKEVLRYAVDSVILERVVFKHKTRDYFLVADAYDGKYIKRCTHDFLNASAGRVKKNITFADGSVGIEGNSEVVVYVGHNGLMDFRLTNNYENEDGKQRKIIILACASRNYFRPYIEKAGAHPLLWTTNLMSPEAYTLSDALDAFIAGEGDVAVREAGARAYSKYQKCSSKAAMGLLVTGY